MCSLIKFPARPGRVPLARFVRCQQFSGQNCGDEPGSPEGKTAVSFQLLCHSVELHPHSPWVGGATGGLEESWLSGASDSDFLCPCHGTA
ncbi:hypothetical protein AAFF_G00236380 [Aldrovandia affinis]|uniref:Uncharacterized protein n=1 Tax=Aldrovandia affinis TaxID=143900 RepID=A0AAD7REE0_9TELE|nr:hypothetical protein AAFF_G00236380 [Aldrovandia affinis]